MKGFYPSSSLHSISKGFYPSSSWGLRSHSNETDRVIGFCTESLGSESSYDGNTTEEEEEEEEEIQTLQEEQEQEEVDMIQDTEERKPFPPPLPSSQTCGVNYTTTSCYFKAVLGNDRVLLKEVKIKRPKILQASREDGRLKLHLLKNIKKDDDDDDGDQHRGLEESEVTRASHGDVKI